MNLDGLPNDTVTLIHAWLEDSVRTYGLSDHERGLFELSLVRVTADTLRGQVASPRDAEWTIVLALAFTIHVARWLRVRGSTLAPETVMRMSSLDDILAEVDKAA